MDRVRHFVTRRSWTSALIVFLVAGGSYWYYSNTHKQSVIAFATVERGSVSQTVSVTGSVKPSSEVKLSFENGGRIAVAYYDVGERVHAGAALVSLDNADLSAQLEQAKATVRFQQAKLEELKKGTRVEDINVSEVSVANASNDVVNDLKNAYVNADDAIRNKVDQLLSNPRSSSPQFNFALSNSQVKNDIETQRPVLEAMFTEWNLSVGSVSTSQDLNFYIDEARNNLRSVQNYLGEVATAVNSLSTNSSLLQTTIDAYKSAVLSGRANITSALDSLSASEEKLLNAQSQLALKEAGTVGDQIDAQEAQVDAAQANVSGLQAQLAKTILRSPISGLVTVQNAKEGEVVGSGSVLVSVISDAKYEIEANVPEADIAKVKIGNEAQVTLDAYGSDALFSATVTKIDPAETMIDGVATYKTTLQFKDNDTRIKSGMTANTDIAGEKRENVLFVPGRTVLNKGTSKTVSLIEGNLTREVTITTGLRGSNGDVEVLSGLKERDKVKTN